MGWIVNRKKTEQSKGPNVFEPFWTFPHCLFPSASIHPLFSLPVLYSTSGVIFPPLLSFFCLFPPLSFPLSACAWWYQCSWTPPLTDNSLDGTLLCTVQCTAILPQWALDLWWMERIPPSVVSGTGQTEGGGSHTEGFLMRVDHTMCVPRILGPSGIFVASICDMEQGGVCVSVCASERACVCVYVWFWFVMPKDCMQLRMWTIEAQTIMYLSLPFVMPALSSVAMGTAAVSCSGLHHNLNCDIRPAIYMRPYVCVSYQ